MKYLLIFVLLIVTAVIGLAQAGPSSSVAQQPVEAAPAQSTPSGGDRDSKPASQSNDGKQTADPAAALDFLGSYSAPQAVLATETRPHQFASALRRRRSAVGRSRKRSWRGASGPGRGTTSIGSNAFCDQSIARRVVPGCYGGLGRGARRTRGRLEEMAPSGDWSLRFQAESLAARYPLSARSLWPGAGPADPSKSEQAKPEQAKSEQAKLDLPASRAATADGKPDPAALSRWRDELARLNGAAESPETVYRRARLLVEISGAAYKLAAASPALDARLFALQALAAEEENDEGAALVEYRAGLAKHPQSGLLHAGLGHLYRERNQLEPALAELTEAARLLPSDPLVAFDLGDVDLRMGQTARALETLNHALDLDPGLLVARWSRGRAYAALGGPDNDQRALEDLEAAVTCDSSGVLQWQLSQLYAKLGRNQEAREAEQKSLDLRQAAQQQKHPAEVKSP